MMNVAVTGVTRAKCVTGEPLATLVWPAGGGGLGSGLRMTAGGALKGNVTGLKRDSAAASGAMGVAQNKDVAPTADTAPSAWSESHAEAVTPAPTVAVLAGRALAQAHVATTNVAGSAPQRSRADYHCGAAMPGQWCLTCPAVWQSPALTRSPIIAFSAQDVA